MHSSSKHTYDGYTITVEFKDEQQFAITASDTYTGETFINEEAELTKIKKDTVLAALTRKNEKNIACKLNLVDVQPRKLIIAFEVSYDFLPTFTEYVSLDQLKKSGTGMNKVESAEIRSDIEELQAVMSSLSGKDCCFVKESTHSFASKGEIEQRELERGSYLVEVSGFFTCNEGGKHDLVFVLHGDGQQLQMSQCLHTNGGYGYPYSFRKELTISKQSTLKITLSHKQNKSFTLTENIVLVTPIVKTN